MDTKQKLWITARRKTGIAKFERECHLKPFGGKMMKAWKVPGTQEAGRHSMLQVATQDEYNRLLARAEGR